MGRDHPTLTRWIRALAVSGVVVAGLLTIVCSSSEGGYTELLCNTFPDSCGPLPPMVAVTPARATVQAANNITFTAQTTDMAEPT